MYSLVYGNVSKLVSCRRIWIQLLQLANLSGVMETEVQHIWTAPGWGKLLYTLKKKTWQNGKCFACFCIKINRYLANGIRHPLKLSILQTNSPLVSNILDHMESISRNWEFSSLQSCFLGMKVIKRKREELQNLPCSFSYLEYLLKLKT